MAIVIAEGAGKDLLTEGMSYHGPATLGRWFVDITKDKGKSTSNSADKGKIVESKFEKNKKKDWKKKADGKKQKEKEVETTKGKDHVFSKYQGCFICSGPHRARDCPMKEKVSELVCQEAESSDSDADVVRANLIQLPNTMRMERQ
ncbi:hypothetical protein LWI28_024193 [Acer negundo]|uniref:Uncharacterized protein n=1 Tax=Acer negundo TaxID=4023 RepID=A0AAD5IH49_ACENE|nr:hypothetical protein LWI28_024193 [Acer negundo]